MDDWQSIYRSAGSDLGIFIKFDKYFESTTETILEKNYKNTKELHEIIEPFITRNPEQNKKHIECNKSLDKPVKAIYHDYNKTAALNAALTEIEKLDKKVNVLLLGRNNFYIEDYLSKSIQISRTGDINREMFSEMNISFKTVHRSKGLEEDFVTIINNEDFKTGFPNKIEEDPILRLVLSDKSEFQFSEERRLFYVSLTRTKSYCYLLVDANKQSIYIDEIVDKIEIINPEMIIDNNAENCPYCKTGHLVLKGEWGNYFMGAQIILDVE